MLLDGDEHGVSEKVLQSRAPGIVEFFHCRNDAGGDLIDFGRIVASQWIERNHVIRGSVKYDGFVGAVFGHEADDGVGTEPARTRDHTERMLRGFGVSLTQAGERICLAGGQTLRATSITVPADISSAAFFLVGAALAGRDVVTVKAVGINPTRTGVLEILRLMGASITCENPREIGGEPIADITVRPAQLHGIDVPLALVPLAIDEFPALFVAAACAQGHTRVTGAEELRHKESDRIATMASGLRTLGAQVTTLPDGIEIEGGPLHGGVIESHGDHRIAMAFAMASLRASAPITIHGCAAIATSFPTFVSLARGAGLAI